MFESLIESIKQFVLYSKEFRIAAPKWSDYSDTIAMEDIVNIKQYVLPIANRLDTKDKDDKESARLMSELSTAAWRIRKRLGKDSDSTQENRYIARNLESIFDAFKEAGVEIVDHTGEQYDSGMALKVLAFQPTPVIITEQIIETIKPTVYHNNRKLQIGEVIVGTPDNVNNE
jgi:hypothetical protein